MERIRDLLAREYQLVNLSRQPLVLTSSWPTAENENLPIHEDKARGVYVKNLSDFYVSNAGEVYEIMRQGGSARAVSATSAFPSLCPFCEDTS